MNYYFTLFIVGAVVFYIFLRLLNVLSYKYKVQKRKKYFLKHKIVASSASYIEYKRVAKKMSSRNSKMRTCGDFWDFILQQTRSPTDDEIENHLSHVFCVEGNK